MSPAALYLAVTQPPGVLAVLSHNAARLPCGLLLPSTSEELPLTALAPPENREALVGDGVVTWTGPVGPVVLRPVREWAPARAITGHVASTAVREAHVALSQAGVARVVGQVLGDARVSGQGLAEAAVRLLGRGPGLTPSGDDLLAGYLVGAYAFSLEVPDLRRVIAARAATATTALSAALLSHAATGECIDQVASLAAALIGRGSAGPAIRRLLAVGHTSGAALADGLVHAAVSALREAA